MCVRRFSISSILREFNCVQVLLYNNSTYRFVIGKMLKSGPQRLLMLFWFILVAIRTAISSKSKQVIRTVLRQRYIAFAREFRCKFLTQITMRMRLNFIIVHYFHFIDLLLLLLIWLEMLLIGPLAFQ